MAQFIAIVRRKYDQFTEADFTPDLLAVEAEQARVLHAEGLFRQVWGHSSPAGAVILVEASSHDAAEAAAKRLPLYQRGMLDLEVLALAPYRGFAPRG